jgi:hypothetical protein
VLCNARDPGGWDAPYQLIDRFVQGTSHSLTQFG